MSKPVVPEDCPLNQLTLDNSHLRNGLSESDITWEDLLSDFTKICPDVAKLDTANPSSALAFAFNFLYVWTNQIKALRPGDRDLSFKAKFTESGVEKFVTVSTFISRTGYIYRVTNTELFLTCNLASALATYIINGFNTISDDSKLVMCPLAARAYNRPAVTELGKLFDKNNKQMIILLNSSTCLAPHLCPHSDVSVCLATTCGIAWNTTARERLNSIIHKKAQDFSRLGFEPNIDSMQILFRYVNAFDIEKYEVEDILEYAGITVSSPVRDWSSPRG